MVKLFLDEIYDLMTDLGRTTEANDSRSFSGLNRSPIPQPSRSYSEVLLNNQEINT